mgnify:CR=1 FL=1
MLYDLPRTEFSLDRARQIEEASWGVTKDLISAFEAESLSPEPEPEPIPEPVAESDTGDATLREALGEYLAFAEALKRRDGDACRRLAAEKAEADKKAAEEAAAAKAAEDAALRASLINQEKLLSNILDAIKKN